MEYTLFWLTGKSEVVNGPDTQSAIIAAGYSHGAVLALDFWMSGNVSNEWKWDKQSLTWKRKLEE